MDSILLRDDAARDRVRQAEEFLDPSMLAIPLLPHVPVFAVCLLWPS